MPDCRIFLFGPDEHITGADMAQCQSDLEAMAAAGVAGEADGGVEVWQHARMIGRINVAVSPVSMDG